MECGYCAECGKCGVPLLSTSYTQSLGFASFPTIIEYGGSHNSSDLHNTRFEGELQTFLASKFPLEKLSGSMAGLSLWISEFDPGKINS